jgi:hypothetical protein
LCDPFESPEHRARAKCVSVEKLNKVISDAGRKRIANAAGRRRGSEDAAGGRR